MPSYSKNVIYKDIVSFLCGCLGLLVLWTIFICGTSVKPDPDDLKKVILVDGGPAKNITTREQCESIKSAYLDDNGFSGIFANLTECYDTFCTLGFVDHKTGAIMYHRYGNN